MMNWMIAAALVAGGAALAPQPETYNALPLVKVQNARSPLQGANCPAPYSVRSPGSNTPTQIRFINELSYPVDLYWIDFDGNWVFYTTVQPGSEHYQQSYSGHAWIAWEDSDCVGQSLYFANNDSGQWVAWHF